MIETDGIQGVHGVREDEEPPVCGTCLRYIIDPSWHAPSCPWREASPVEDALEGSE